MTPTITLTDAPGPGVRDAMVAPLRAFNTQGTGYFDKPWPLVLTVSAPGSTEIAGGLWSSTAWDYLHVDLLVVPEDLRGRGIGRTLMRQAEDEAVRRGCRSAWLDTFSFQARGFYEKLGYTVFGTLDEYPAGHHRFFLTRALAPDAR